jgi:hypothetical protein
MRIVWGFVLALVVVCAGTKLFGADARADGPVATSFTEPGTYSYTVPAGVTSVHVVAVGAPGGDGATQKGGRGAIATADVAVTPGRVLSINVGGPGAPASASSHEGGFNGGGGTTAAGSGSGGGATDVRTGGAKEFATRLVVAGGGGGGGYGTNGGTGSAGADAGQTAATPNAACTGGGGATTTEGGAAGNGPSKGEAGSLAQGGKGGLGAGGGGGLFGGGGGGGYSMEGIPPKDGCGGGGGSSGFGPGTTATSVAVSESRTPSVTISYVPPASPAPPVAPSGGGTTKPSGGGKGTTRAALSLTPVQHGKAVSATVQIRASRSSLKAKLLWQKARNSKQLVFGSLVEAPLKKGLHSFTVKLSGKGQKKLAALGALKMELSVAVTPPRGPSRGRPRR